MNEQNEVLDDLHEYLLVVDTACEDSENDMLLYKYVQNGGQHEGMAAVVKKHPFNAYVVYDSTLSEQGNQGVVYVNSQEQDDLQVLYTAVFTHAKENNHSHVRMPILGADDVSELKEKVKVARDAYVDFQKELNVELCLDKTMFKVRICDVM